MDEEKTKYQKNSILLDDSGQAEQKGCGVKRLSPCIKSFVLVTMFVASASWCHAEQSPSANELVVEASQLILSADSAATPEQAISLLEAAHRKLLLIIEVHPSSDLAVKLATGQGIGTVSLAGVQAAIKAVTEQCWDSLSLLCVTRLTLDALMAEEESYWHLDAFITVAAAQMKVGAVEAAQATWKRATDIAASSGFWGVPFARISEAQAEAGQFDAAVKTVELIEEYSGAPRVEALLNIAAAQRRAGKAEEAQLLIDKTVAFAASIDDTERRAYALWNIAKIQTKVGNVADARMTAQRAADTARSIQDPSDQAKALSNIASAYIDIGDRESAKVTIDQAVTALQSALQSERDRRWFSALTTIAKVQTKAGQNEAAQQTLTRAFEAAQAIEDMYMRLTGLFEIAAAQTEMGDAESARLTMDTAIKHFKAAKKDSALLSTFQSSGIGRVPLEAGQLTEVLAIYKLTPEADLYFLARGLTKGGTVRNGIMEVLKLIDIRELKDSILDLLARRQASATQFAEALKTVQLIEDPKGRVRLLANIALAQAKSGQGEAARATISLVTEAVKLREEDFRMVCSFLDLAEAQVEVGLAWDAKDTLHDILRNTKFAITNGGNPNCDPRRSLGGVLEVLVKMHDAALL